MSFGLGSSDLLEIRRLQAITCANNPKIIPSIFEGPPGLQGPTGPPGPAAFMNGGYDYFYRKQEELASGCFSFSPGKDILEAKQLQLSLVNASGVHMNDYFFQIPIGSRVFLYNRSNSITHAFVLKSYIRYNGIYIFEVELTTPISYVPTSNESYIISFSIRGPVGEGVPGGGSPGQVLVKLSEKDYDVEWCYPSHVPSGLPYIARGRIPNIGDTAYLSLDNSKKWAGGHDNYVCKLTGSDMAKLTVSGDSSVFLKGTFTGQQQWSITYNTVSGAPAGQYTIIPPTFIGKANPDGSTPFYILSAGCNIPIAGSGTSWILWNL